jgi:type III secretion protein R
MRPVVVLLALYAVPRPAMAQDGSMPNPVVLVIVLGALALAPFMLMMLTAFIKISVVLSILRNALGTQQVPPNPVVTGLAFILMGIFALTRTNHVRTADAILMGTALLLWGTLFLGLRPLRRPSECRL